MSERGEGRGHEGRPPGTPLASSRHTYSESALALEEHAALLARLDDWTPAHDPGPLIRWAAAYIRGTREPSSGLDLKLERVRRRISQRELAEAWGVWRTHVYGVEASASPTPRTIERYLAALRLAEAQREGSR